MKFPGIDERVFVTGKTGTGKSIFGLWLLSLYPYDKMPFVIIDSKLDPTIADIPRLTEIAPSDRIPKRPGLYVIRPSISDLNDGAMTEWLYKVWKRENTGLFFDEGMQFNPRDKGVQAVMTQGRSKRIPVISLSQRPVNCAKCFMSEAEYFAVFYLHTPADLVTIGEWLPPRGPGGERLSPEELPNHHCWWYGSGSRELIKFSPCPPPSVILDTFDKRMPRRFMF